MATTISELLGIDETQIIPGTTPKLEIAIDNDIITSTSSVRIDVVQNDKVILQITEADIDKENKKITYIFTQSDTNTMKKGTVKIQVHGITSDGTAWKSSILSIPVGESLTNTQIM